MPATTWMNPEGIMLNEIRQSQENKHHMIDYPESSKSQSRLVGARDWGGRMGS